MMKKYLVIPLVLITLLSAGCSSAAVTPTLDEQATLQAVSTQAASTVLAQVSTMQTATALAPTATQAATNTPQATATLAATATALASATPTIYVPIYTATHTAVPYTSTPVYTATSVDYSCQITASSPATNKQYSKNASFDGVWTLKNTGAKIWYKQEVDLRYASGQKMQTKADVFDLGADTKPGESYTFTLDMTAPSSDGTYTMTWNMIYGHITICTFSSTIVVK